MPSVVDSIVTAAVTRITSIPATGYTVIERVDPVVIEDDALPLVLVAVTDQRQEPATAEDDFAWFGYYTLSVVVVAKKTGVKPSPSVRELSQAITRKLSQPGWNEFAAVDDVDPAPTKMIDPTKLDKAYLWAPLAFTVRTMEPR